MSEDVEGQVRTGELDPEREAARYLNAGHSIGDTAAALAPAIAALGLALAGCASAGAPTWTYPPAGASAAASRSH